MKAKEEKEVGEGEGVEEELLKGWTEAVKKAYSEKSCSHEEAILLRS